MAWTLERLDPDRRRRRLRLLAEIAGARSLRDRLQSRRVQGDRRRELIVIRRRLAG